MEARKNCTATAIAVFFCLTIVFGLGTVHAAGYRTQNFLVTTPSPEFSKQVGDAAEAYRRELALEWLGHELPPWRQPCPITINVGPNLPAGGATTFAFAGNSGPVDWHMEIQGSAERILDSVLPHEITHTIFATHFRRPLPRWADEGACTTVECESERANHQRMLLRYLTSVPSRGIAFNRMVEMTEYPRDIMPLYAQGHSVVQYLLYHGGKQKFVAFVGDGMRMNDWDMALEHHYGYDDLSDLQLKWVEWVRNGSPAIAADEPRPSTPDAAGALAAAESAEQDAVVVRGQAPAAKSSLLSSLVGGDSWYARQRDAQPPAVAATLDGDPHQGPPIHDESLPPVPAATPQVPVQQATRTPDQRPKPFRTSSNATWQPASTSIVRKATMEPATLHPEKSAPILFDAPLRGAETFWR